MADETPRSKPPGAPPASAPTAGQLDVTQAPPLEAAALGATGAFDPPADALLGTRATPGKTDVGALNADATQGAGGLDQTQDSGVQGSNADIMPGQDADEENLRTSLRDFRLIKKLGEGGMGKVYKAQQISLDRVVAVKVPFKHLAKDASFVQRFYREARIMARLDHPHILRCFSVGEESGWHYLAMEFIDGASMQNWLEKLGKLSIRDALHVALATAHALQHAHEQDMIHRDIKPDNILVTNKGVVKVADMGLAKVLTDDLSLSRTGTGAGTPHYMAPEQARDAKHVDNRCDIYALGCMLYCFLGGKPPFSAETYMELILAKEKGKYPPIRRLNPEVPERLELMIDKAIANKPEVRVQDLRRIHQRPGEPEPGQRGIELHTGRCSAGPSNSGRGDHEGGRLGSAKDGARNHENRSSWQGSGWWGDATGRARWRRSSRRLVHQVRRGEREARETQAERGAGPGTDQEPGIRSGDAGLPHAQGDLPPNQPDQGV